MASYIVGIFHKLPNKKAAFREVFTEANSPAQAKKIAVQTIAEEYPQHETVEVHDPVRMGTLVIQGRKFMPNVYQRPARVVTSTPAPEAVEAEGVAETVPQEA